MFQFYCLLWNMSAGFTLKSAIPQQLERPPKPMGYCWSGQEAPLCLLIVSYVLASVRSGKPIRLSKFQLALQSKVYVFQYLSKWLVQDDGYPPCLKIYKRVIYKWCNKAMHITVGKPAQCWKLAGMSWKNQTCRSKNYLISEILLARLLLHFGNSWDCQPRLCHWSRMQS